jgi:hypothetical protein
MPSTDRKLELKAKTSMAQTASQAAVYAKGLIEHFTWRSVCLFTWISVSTSWIFLKIYTLHSLCIGYKHYEFYCNRSKIKLTFLESAVPFRLYSAFTGTTRVSERDSKCLPPEYKYGTQWRTERECGAPPPHRSSEAFTNLSRIPSSVENTSLITK